MRFIVRSTDVQRPNGYSKKEFKKLFRKKKKHKSEFGVIVITEKR